jgi:hypothetical protein
MKEKRKVERFNLNIETILNVHTKKIMGKNPMLLSRDISSAGVFLETDNPLPIGMKVDLDFLLSQNHLGNGSSDKKIKINTTGFVIRKDDQGMAIEFEKMYKISQLNEQL